MIHCYTQNVTVTKFEHMAVVIWILVGVWRADVCLKGFVCKESKPLG